MPCLAWPVLFDNSRVVLLLSLGIDRCGVSARRRSP